LNRPFARVAGATSASLAAPREPNPIVDSRALSNSLAVDPLVLKSALHGALFVFWAVRYRNWSRSLFAYRGNFKAREIPIHFLRIEEQRAMAALQKTDFASCDETSQRANRYFRLL
jgi:hypothetical protein